jgi:hypothetical protein
VIAGSIAGIAGGGFGASSMLIRAYGGRDGVRIDFSAGAY